MVVSKWYEVYRKKIKEARSNNELDVVIDEIFEEGVGYGRETGGREGREPIYNEGYD